MLAAFHNIFHPGIDQGKRIGAFIVDSENQNIDRKEKVECIYKYSKLTKMMGKKNILHESVS
jgi:hypothetical protein